VIEVKNLYKTFDGEKMVLNGIDYNIKKGERIVVIGPSGGGKSTFLRCINLLEKPTSGEIWVDGKLKQTLNGYADNAWGNVVTELIVLGKNEPHTVEIRMAEGQEGKNFQLLDIAVVP